MIRSRKPKINLIGKVTSNGVVEDVCVPGKWKVRCNHCGELHSQTSRAIFRNSKSRNCNMFKPHNWSGLDRWDAIIRRVYGISLLDYESMLKIQGGGCFICGKTEEEEGRRLAIDHCHITNIVRGLLCGVCNQAIGMLRHDPEIISKAMNYCISPPFKYARAR